MASWRSSKGLTRVEALVVVLVSVFILSLLSPASRRAKSDADRAVCAANLATLGKAMLLYANDYQNEFPRAGGRTSNWGDAVRWNATNRYLSFGLEHVYVCPQGGLNRPGQPGTPELLGGLTGMLADKGIFTDAFLEPDICHPAQVCVLHRADPAWATTHPCFASEPRPSGVGAGCLGFATK